MMTSWLLLCVALGGVSFGQSSDDDPRQSTRPPYPASPVLKGIELDWSTHIRLAPGSDNWPTTWADDGHLYTAWGDGGGFDGTNRRGRVSLGVARIEGTPEEPESLRGINLWGGHEPQRPADFAGKSYGILCVDGVLYMWWVPDPLPHLAETRIAYSTDHGLTWQRTDWAFTFEDKLAIPTFLNYGRNYAGARDGYVYSYYIQPQYGPGPATDPLSYEGRFDVNIPGAIYLSRVPKDRILDRAAYEFFAGLDERSEPRWAAEIEAKRPVFEDPNGVGWNVSVACNAGLGRYLLATEHGRTHRGFIGVFDAPEPWGPWTTVLYNNAWGEGHVPLNTFYWSFPTKWMSDDGLGFTLLFTGREENDSFNAVRGRFTRQP